VKGHANAAAEAVDTDHPHEGTKKFHVWFSRQASVYDLLKPLPREPPGVCNDPMDGIYSHIRQRSKVVVLSGDRRGSEGFLAGLAE
jgi:hypothetical protein